MTKNSTETKGIPAAGHENERRAPPIELGQTDREILKRLEEDGRESVSKIAAELRISASLVRRRIAFLKETGVISKFTVVVDHWKIGRRIEAYLLLRIDIKGDLKALRRKVRELERVREVATLAGDEDMLVRLRVSDPAELTDTVLEIRQMEGVTKTKTLVSLGRERHLSEGSEDDDDDSGAAGVAISG